MEPITMTLAVLGAIQGVGANIQRKRAAELEEMVALRRKKANEREMNLASRIMGGEMTIAALSATNEAKSAAVETFKAESAAEASLGVSGLRSGTMQSQMEIARQDAEEALSGLSRSSTLRLQNLHTQDEMQINAYRDRAMEADLGLEGIKDSLGYLSSPFSFIMAAGIGGLSGAALGNKIETGLVNMTGKTSGGWLDEWFKPEAVNSGPAVFPRNASAYPMPWEMGANENAIPAWSPAYDAIYNPPAASSYFGGKSAAFNNAWGIFQPTDSLLGADSFSPGASIVNDQQFLGPWFGNQSPQASMFQAFR